MKKRPTHESKLILAKKSFDGVNPNLKCVKNAKYTFPRSSGYAKKVLQQNLFFLNKVLAYSE